MKGNITGGLYDGTAYKNSFYIPSLRKAKLSWSEINTGITLADSLAYGKWDVLLAVSRKHEHFRNEIKGQLIRNDDWLPTFGITYKANDHLSFSRDRRKVFPGAASFPMTASMSTRERLWRRR